MSDKETKRRDEEDIDYVDSIDSSLTPKNSLRSVAELTNFIKSLPEIAHAKEYFHSLKNIITFLASPSSEERKVKGVTENINNSEVEENV